MQHYLPECTEYYCLQQKGGGQYFQGVSHQRGYGFFSDVFRHITPLAIKAGKYFGRHLLSSGSKVFSDVRGGKSFKDSARSRFKETSKSMRDDLLARLQRGSGIKRKRKQNAKHSKSKRRRNTTSKTQIEDIFS